jgi:galactonate dehydratase
MARVLTAQVFRVAPRWLFVRMETDDGIVGWGEAIVPKRAAAVTGAVEDLLGNIIGEDPDRIEDLWQRMRNGGFFRNGPVLDTASAALEQALWDIKGQRYSLPVYEFLGGAVRERVRTYAWVGGDRPDDVVDQVSNRIAQGYTAVKMNATTELDYVDRSGVVDALVARVGAVRDKFGTSVDVALDFHGRVHRAMTKVLLRELEQFQLLWVEEPVPPGQEDLLPELARVASSIPLATGERISSRADFARLLEQRVFDIIQPDVSLTGLFELEKLCRMAEAYDVAVAPHCPNGPISLAASLQVGLCAGNVIIQECSVGLHYNRGYADLPKGEIYDYLLDRGPLTTEGGFLARPGGPGLGIRIDEQAVADSPGWILPDPEWRLPDGRLAEW